ncbi:MAG: dienelactone hydrolase family protein [Pirellula sp.]|jgi:predicted peptidase
MFRALSRFAKLGCCLLSPVFLFGAIVAVPIASSLGDDNAPLTVEELSKIFEPREYIGTNNKPLKYRLLKPMGYEFGKKYPLLVFLHGAGERGADNVITLKHGAREFVKEDRRKQYPAYILIPQCPSEAKWSNTDWSQDSSMLPENASDSMQSLKELIDEMVENAGVDSDRILLTGLSMGGYGTWDAIARYPGFFAAAAPICGGGDPSTVNRFAGLPIWCFHGAKDSVVKVSRSREMVEAIKKTGAQIRYTEYPDAEHDSWTTTYANPEFYSWIFTQKKSKTIE